MKKNTKFSLMGLFLSLLLIISSCEKIEDASSFDIEPTFTTIVECKVPAILNVTNTAVFSNSSIIDPRSDTKVNIYLNSIKEYEVQSITATVTDLSFEKIYLIKGDFMLNNFNREIKWSFENELMTVGKTFDLSSDKEKMKSLAQSFLDGQEIGLIIGGMADRSDVSFTIKVEIKTKAKVKVL